MRLYAFLLLVAALYAHAASIPVAETEKKLVDVIPDNLDKTENLSSEQELIDQANTIKDVENKLRVKPEDIPVKVIVEDAQSVLKNIDINDESEEINRPVPDLRNPGPPQRQEHETQNPGYYANEEQVILKFKQSINEAQSVLKQGFQGITDGIQNMLENNEPIQKIQHNIQSLREGFTSQINKLNGTIQNYLSNKPAADQPAVEQTKASFQQIEKGLKLLKNEFNAGVHNLADGVQVVAYLKAERQNQNNPDSNPAPANPPTNIFAQYISNIQNGISNMLQGLSPNNNQGSGTAAPPGAQSDTPTAPANNNFFSFISQWWSNQQSSISSFTTLSPSPVQGASETFQNSPWGQNQFVQYLTNVFSQNKPTTSAPQVTQKPTESKPETKPEPEKNPETKPEENSGSSESSEKPAADVPVTPTGPIRQILQNNPISKGIASAVQRLQNINNPEKPRDTVKTEKQQNNAEVVKKPDEEKPDSESKGHYGSGGNNSGDNNNSNSSGLKENEVIKQEIKLLPEVEKPKEVELKEHKTEVVVDKAE